MSPAPRSASHGGGRLLARPRWRAAGEEFGSGAQGLGEKLPPDSAAWFLQGATP